MQINDREREKGRGGGRERVGEREREGEEGGGREGEREREGEGGRGRERDRERVCLRSLASFISWKGSVDHRYFVDELTVVMLKM